MFNFKTLLKNFSKNSNGSIMPLTAVMLPLILGMTGVGVDVSMWAMSKKDLQAAVDAASIAAAWEIAYDLPENITAAALKEAMNNGYDPTRNGTIDLVLSTDDEGNTVVTANISQESDVWFSGILTGDSNISIGVRAATAVLPPTGDFCLLSLDETADGAISAVGSVTIESAGCGIAINSNDPAALDLTGVVTIDIKDINIVGDYDMGPNVTLNYETLKTNASRTVDPYKDLEVPDYGSCDENNYRANGNATLSPGVYCGGIALGGNGTVTMEPGVYIMDAGDFSASGGGELIGEGVSIILTNSTGNDNKWGEFDVSGNREVTLTAPAEGEDMAGIAIYQDRNTPEGNAAQCNKLTGTAEVILDGAAYFPSQCFTIGGTHDASSPAENPCSRIIAKTIKFNGNPYIANNCDGSAAEDIGEITVKLVL